MGRRCSPFPQPSARHQFTLPDHGYGARASRGVPVYVPAFASTHCAYPRRGGQAELTWVAGYIPSRFTCLAASGDHHPSKYSPGPTWSNFVNRTQRLKPGPMQPTQRNIRHRVYPCVLAAASLASAAFIAYMYFLALVACVVGGKQATQRQATAC